MYDQCCRTYIDQQAWGRGYIPAIVLVHTSRGHERFQCNPCIIAHTIRAFWLRDSLTQIKCLSYAIPHIPCLSAPITCLDLHASLESFRSLARVSSSIHREEHLGHTISLVTPCALLTPYLHPRLPTPAKFSSALSLHVLLQRPIHTEAYPC